MLSTRTGKKAFTLTELMIGMAIVAVIGLAVVGIASALAYADSSTDSMHESIQSARLAMMKMKTVLRSAKLVAAASNGRLVLWTGDANDDKQINITELVLVKYDAGAGTIEYWQVAFPESMPAGRLRALNVTVTLDEATEAAGVENLLSQATYASYLAKPAWALGATSFEMAVDADPPLSRLVVLRLGVGPIDQHIEVSSAVRLRADATQYVQNVEDSWTLDLP